MRKLIKNLRKPINKLRFLKFLKKAETDQKYEETDLKIWGNWSKKRGNHSTLNIGKRIQNIRKSLNNSELLRDFLEFLKKTGNASKIIFDPFPCWGVSVSPGRTSKKLTTIRVFYLKCRPNRIVMLSWAESKTSSSRKFVSYHIWSYRESSVLIGWNVL